jgi:methanogenic corrinoid protein MtbC1
MQREVLTERFFTALISGARRDAQELIDEAIRADCPADRILNRLFWPTLQHIQKLYRDDQISDLAHNYATRMMRALVAQLQPRLERRESRNIRVSVVSGAEQSEELAAQIVSDLLDADGYEVLYVGGGIANDEIVAELGRIKVDVLVVFGAVPSTVPQTRLLIDRLHDIGVCPTLQIVVGGGVFNRAEGLAEEVGSDLWANDPEQIIAVMAEKRDQRMSATQRTVGRRRRSKKDAA